MNLAITPVNYKGNHLQTKNCKNNSQQNFEAIKVTILPHSEEMGEKLVNTGITRRRDIVVDMFMGKLTETAKKICLDMATLERKNYHLTFVPEFPRSSKMIGFLENSKNQVVKDHAGRPVTFNVRSEQVEAQAENFAHAVQGLKLEA